MAKTLKQKIAEEQKFVKVHTTKSKDYRSIHASAAMGGPTPNGEEFVLLFYTEQNAFAETSYLVLDDDGITVTDTRSEIPEYQIAREVQIGVHMGNSEARNLAYWILRRLDEREERLKGVKDEQ